MNILQKKFLKFGLRYFNTSQCSTKTLFAENLVERNLIRAQGKEIVPFLQGLITNDMAHLERGATSMYTMFLNKAGRVLYDSIIYRTSQNDTYLIECDRNVVNELKRHLRLFRVRRKIEIDTINSDYKIWSVFSLDQDENLNIPSEGSVAIKNIVSLANMHKNELIEEIIVCHDPRMKSLGARLILPDSFDLNNIQTILERNKIELANTNNDYQYLRCKLGVGEGILDHPPTKCFPMESNCDFLHGVSFHKGCYIGQEFTARTYHTGVIRKRLMPVRMSGKIPITTNCIQAPNGNVLGKIRSIKNDYALALMRVEQALDSMSLLIDGNKCDVIRPEWWPKPIKKIVAKEQTRKKNVQQITTARKLVTIGGHGLF